MPGPGKVRGDKLIGLLLPEGAVLSSQSTTKTSQTCLGPGCRQFSGVVLTGSLRLCPRSPGNGRREGGALVTLPPSPDASSVGTAWSIPLAASHELAAFRLDCAPVA